MKTIFAIGAASLALATAGTASAQDIEAVSFDLGDTVSAPAAETDVAAPGPIIPMAVEPSYRDISPFYGNIGAFYRDISPFYGNIGAFYGDISPFYGNIGAFWRDISPFYGNIGAFWGDINAFNSTNLQGVGDFGKQLSTLYSEANDLWLRAETDPSVMPLLDAKLGQIYDLSAATWGSKVTAKTGKSFDAGFAQAMYAKHGFKPGDYDAIRAMSRAQRGALLIDWHDQLLEFSGVDHVDWWMRAVNWTPLITQEQGSGYDTTIGIIDASVISDQSLLGNVLWSAKGGTDLNGHGAGVASLLYGAHDGKGVMGIAPGVKVTTYNPFAADGTADWSDIRAGISKLKAGNLTTWLNGGEASIINMSLGEKGWTLAPGFNEVFSAYDVAAYRNNTVYVVAAGNDGISQSKDIAWNFATDPALIVVGSVGPNGQISSFSNRPGTACLLDNGKCLESNRLYMRTIVAPGEMLLMSDGNGGVTRGSGTSFAAPLVSGAISLLHDRWPWLRNYPKETTEVIFKSATDLGAPGPDPVYGWGMLNVAASQAPLNFNNLTYTKWDASGWWLRSSTLSSSQVLSGGLQTSTWESRKIFFTVFESIGRTYRDFKIPMSALLYGARTNAGSGSFETLQSFISGRFGNWIKSGGSDSNGDGRAGLTELNSTTGQIPGGWKLRYDAMAPLTSRRGELDMQHASATLTDPKGKLAVTVGYGQGATALAGGRFGLASDSDRFTGGVNPVLGFASGETFMAAKYNVADNTSVRFGFSENRTRPDEIPGLTSQEESALEGLEDHAAHAFTMDMDHRVNDRVSVNVQFTKLVEDTALLGTQSTISDFMGRGTGTDAITFAASVDAGSGIAFDLSATGARSKIRSGQDFATPGGVYSTAAKFAVTKHGVAGERDILRLSVAQPLTVERGTVEFTGVEVIDRMTGQLGQKTYGFSIEGKRRQVGEAVYAAPLGDRGEMGLYGRYETAGNPGETENYTLGGRFSMSF